MSFTWGEVSKWAKDHGYKISRKEQKFYWTNTTTEDSGECYSLEDLTKSVFNKITNDKWVDHQKNYEKKQK